MRYQKTQRWSAVLNTFAIDWPLLTMNQTRFWFSYFRLDPGLHMLSLCHKLNKPTNWRYIFLHVNISWSRYHLCILISMMNHFVSKLQYLTVVNVLGISCSILVNILIASNVWNTDEKYFLIIDYLTRRWYVDNEGSCELCVGTEGKDVSAPGGCTATDCFVNVTSLYTS